MLAAFNAFDIATRHYAMPPLRAARSLDAICRQRRHALALRQRLIDADYYASIFMIDTPLRYTYATLPPPACRYYAR